MQGVFSSKCRVHGCSFQSLQGLRRRGSRGSLQTLVTSIRLIRKSKPKEFRFRVQAHSLL